LEILMPELLASRTKVFVPVTSELVWGLLK
jgi:hypothetical protein